DLVGTEDFSSFVKPHLAIGPRGDHNPEPPSLKDLPNQTGSYSNNPFASYFINAAYKPDAAIENPIDESIYRPDFAKAVKIAPKGSVEIEIPVSEGNDFGLTFMALPDISATLYNDKGALVGKNPAKTPEANAAFRSIYVDKGVTGGTW